MKADETFIFEAVGLGWGPFHRLSREREEREELSKVITDNRAMTSSECRDSMERFFSNVQRVVDECYIVPLIRRCESLLFDDAVEELLP